VNENRDPVFTAAELEASLTRLGAADLEQRLEFAPLLAGSGDTGPLDTDVSVCCSCKIPDKLVFDENVAPIITGDPYPGSDISGTGPVSGGGF